MLRAHENAFIGAGVIGNPIACISNSSDQAKRTDLSRKLDRLQRRWEFFLLRQSRDIGSLIIVLVPPGIYMAIRLLSSQGGRLPDWWLDAGKLDSTCNRSAKLRLAQTNAATISWAFAGP